MRPTYRRDTSHEALNTIARAAKYLIGGPKDALIRAKADRPDDFDLHDAIMTRAAVVPTSASTVTAFNQTAVSDLGSIIGPMSGFTQITGRALGVTRGRETTLSIPHAIAAADTFDFVQQGAPISVKQFAFGSATLAARKAVGIVAVSRELSEHSDADKIIKALMIENIGISIDKKFLDANADDGVRPAGLRFGTAALSSAGSTMLEDLATLGAAVAPKASSMEDIVYVASVDLAIKIALALPNLKIPVISTAGFSAGTIAAMVPSALAVTASPEIKFDVSNSSGLHMDDAPSQISTVATPNTVAAPVRSLWQTDTKAIRVIFEVDYKWRTSGTVAWMTSIGW